MLLSSDSSYLLDTSGDKVPFLGEDTGDKHETSIVAPSKRHDILLHDKCFVARRGHNYISPFAQDCAGPKADGSSPTSKVYAMPKDTFKDSSSNGSWIDDNDDDHMSLEFNHDVLPFGTKSLAAGWSPPLSPPLSPVEPMTLYGKKGSSRVCPSYRKEANILDRIWPGSHNITFFTHFVFCHFAGDWSAYLLFAHWVDSRLLEHQDSEIHLNKWLSLNLDLDDGGAPGVGKSGNDDGAPGDHGGGGLDHNILCNKTTVDVVDLVHSDRTGDRTGTLSPPQHASPIKT